MYSRPNLSLRRVLEHIESYSLGSCEPPRSKQAPSNNNNNKSNRANNESPSQIRRNTKSRNLNKQRLFSILKDKLIEDIKWCWMNATIPVIAAKSQTPFEFFRNFVNKNTPCIIEDLNVCGWTGNWDWKTVVERSGKGIVRINATPTGRGDAIIVDPSDKSRVFVAPEERMMEFSEFMNWLVFNREGPLSSRDVLYLSAQNDSLREEFIELIESGFAPPSLEFGDEVFGKKCEASNLWIGDHRAVSTIHRDITYENIYCVLRGKKVFHLLPPCCAPFLGEKPYPNAQYRKSSSNDEWIIQRNPGDTPWIEMDVAAEELEKSIAISPEFEMIVDLVQRVEISTGQTLYLPAGWFHRVTQTEATVAVNYWYDHDFNAAWALTETIEEIVKSTSS